MSLDALAPDQRAVVQLVLQQDRTYEDLASLLGITPEAVRARAHRGMERLAPGDAVDPDDRAQIADYLLGQQSVSGREATRSLLTASQPARSWALTIAFQLAGVARSPLPEVPSGATAAPETEPERTEPVIAGDPEPVLEEPVTPTRARPRPRQRATETPPADFGFGEAAGTEARDHDKTASGDEPARTSRLGGALLIAGLAIFVAALVIFLVSRGDDEDTGTQTATTGTNSAEATPTPSGTPQFALAANLRLQPADGGDASAVVKIFANVDTRQLGFSLRGTGLEPTAEGRAYGLWLVGGAEDHFLGYAAPVAEDGKLATSGPRPQDAAQFGEWLVEGGASMILTTETQPDATEPGPTVLEGPLKNAKVPGGAAATPAP